MARFATRDGHVLRFLLGCYLAALVLLVFTQGGCGPNARQKSLSASLTSVNALRAGFLEFNERHMNDLVDRATSREDAQAKLAAYRERRTVVINAFEAAYRAIALASLDTKSQLSEIATVVTQLVTAFDALKKSAQAP